METRCTFQAETGEACGHPAVLVDPEGGSALCPAHSRDGMVPGVSYEELWQPITCVKCGYTSKPGESETCCPNCGYDPNREHGVQIAGTWPVPTTMTFTLNRPELTHGPAFELKVKLKRGGKSGLPAKEVQVTDRMDPEVSHWRQTVEEFHPDGSWEEVHRHEKSGKARHRPKKKNDATT